MSQMQIGERTFTIGCIRDISGRKAYTEALEHRTLHDDLTGLPNRTLFGDRMDRAIAAADRADEPRGVLVVDLDEFRRGQRDARARERATRCCRRSPSGSAPRCATRTRWPAWAATSSASCPPATDRRRGRPRRSPGRSARRSRSRSSSSGHVRRRAREHRDRLLPPARPHRPPTCCAAPSWRCTRPSAPAAGSRVFVTEPEDQTARRLTLLSELREGIPRGELVLHFQPQGRPARRAGPPGSRRWCAGSTRPTGC